jgi:hypothetical protein
MPRLPGRKPKGPADKKPAKDEMLFPYTGLIQEIKTDTIVMAAEDTRVITFKCGKVTKYLKEDKELKQFKAGDWVTIESRKDDEGNFYAVNVKWEEKPATATPAPAATASAAKPETKPESKPDSKQADSKQPDSKQEEVAEATRSDVVTVPPRMTGADNEAPPKLHRGKPKPRPAQKEEPEDEPEPIPAAASTPATASKPAPTAVAQVRPPAAPAEERPDDAPPALTRATPADPDEAFIFKAREMAEEFSQSLPNFICNQMTTHFQTEGKPVSWQPVDVVTAAIVYEDGKESYRNVAVNGKLTKKSMEENAGGWSTGEFGTTLRDVMSPYTDARFYNRRESNASGLSAYKYDYEVEQPNSHWKTIIGGQSVMPAYRGSIWFDKKSYRVLRIEMDARKIPEEFPADHIEWAVDYGFVKIGGNEYLLPTHAENLTCWRGSTRCAKGTIDFRNYRKFTGESQILQTDSTITYEGEDSKKPEDAKKPHQ